MLPLSGLVGNEFYAVVTAGTKLYQPGRAWPCLGLEMHETTRPKVKGSGQSMKNYSLGVCRIYVENGASVVLF